MIVSNTEAEGKKERKVRMTDRSVEERRKLYGGICIPVRVGNRSY